MFMDEYPATKEIVTPDGEDEFQLRYIQDDNVGIATTRSGKSYLILDSIEYWYDLIQDRYPPKRKCRCKNDFCKVRFGYIPRIGTDDYRAVTLTTICTECGKEKKMRKSILIIPPLHSCLKIPSHIASSLK